MDFIPLVPEQQKHLNELNISNPHLDNISRLLIVPPALDFVALKRTISYLLHYHDALRLRFTHCVSGWQQFIAEEEEVPLHQIDISTDFEQRKTIESEAAKWQTSLNVFEGPLFRVVYFDAGAQQPGRLLLIFHHLITDAFSMEIFSQDCIQVYQQISQGKEPHLQKTQNSFNMWAERLKVFTQSATLQQELECYWLALPWHKIISLPIDYPGGGWDTNTRASTSDVSISLSLQETQVFLSIATAEIPILDILLMALALTVTRWTNSSTLYVATIDHGRMIFKDINVSHTIGLFACFRYLFLDLEGIDTPKDALQAIKTQIQQVPQQGIGYGLLRYLNDNAHTIEKMRHIPRCEIVLNYFGRRREGSSIFQIADENQGPTLDMRNMRPQIVALESIIRDKKFSMRWLYSANIHRRSTIEFLAQNYMENLNEIIAVVRSLVD